MFGCIAIQLKVIVVSSLQTPRPPNLHRIAFPSLRQIPHRPPLPLEHLAQQFLRLPRFPAVLTAVKEADESLRGIRGTAIWPCPGSLSIFIQSNKHKCACAGPTRLRPLLLPNRLDGPYLSWRRFPNLPSRRFLNRRAVAIPSRFQVFKPRETIPHGFCRVCHAPGSKCRLTTLTRSTADLCRGPRSGTDGIIGEWLRGLVGRLFLIWLKSGFRANS